MAKFIEGNKLVLELENILKKAEFSLWIISPFIKLHPRYKDALKGKMDNHKLEIVLLFGKNETDKIKSFPREEIDFFQNFPNIEIRYEERLHAKYYANENTSILTSMNLFEFSQNNNIEAGVLMEPLPLVNNLDKQASDYFIEVINNSELLFKKEPQYETKLGFIKKFKNSIITENKFEDIIKEKPVLKHLEKSKNTGYCISCNKEIKLDPKHPYCLECYKSGKKEIDQKEKYCHICGLEHNVSFSKPTCFNCYRKNKNKLEFTI